MSEEVVFPKPFDLLDPTVFDEVMVWASNLGASDVELIPNDPIWMRLHGQWHPVTPQREVTTSEIGVILDASARQANASALTQSGTDVDFSHEIKISRGKKVRFRCNATGCRDGWTNGISMVLRTIPELPPKIDDLGVEPEILAAAKPKYGLVLVTGPVGSGKSTLLFSVLRDIAETEQRNILTYEAPIEFDLMSVPNRKAPVVQTEVPGHLKDFETAPRNSLRRAGDVGLFGESRDRTTMRNMSIEAETGVAVYSTVHTNSVAETISRMVREFPWEERDGMAATLLAATRLIVHQRLVPNLEGTGRVALREYLVMDETVRRALISKRVDELIPAMEALVEERGQTLLADAKAKFEAGKIPRREYEMFREAKEVR